ncbi:GNAT family N-acetyltransferase [Gynuella sunshinyii]|uniref:Acetyltransferase, including N-acetylase of ribosomal protein n=1 Tax=Gynuella sunshinyii YC6258 TaxID=1445510 RepID=A0A0C5VN04_9GAMM|nr:GNAT family protein [Gynuella sunshinyii]AJQ94708.1 acetyltransferase, including N-acetylase of ribosomal protein [Gynuella sunshinyii YC6258]
MFKIETNRLWLRDFQPSDVQSYVRFTANPDYQKYYSEEDCRREKSEFLANQFVVQARDVPRRKYQLAIIEKSSDQLIGTCGIRAENDNHASMGFGIAVEYQGIGYAFEAARSMICFGFQALGVYRIYAETLAANHSAVGLCERLGMHKEEHLIEHRFFKGCWWDTVVYALKRNE